MGEAKRDEAVGLTRAEVEILCILEAVGVEGCTATELPARLGLSPALARAVGSAVETLVAEGVLSVEGGRVQLTQPGEALLTAQLQVAVTAPPRRAPGRATPGHRRPG